MSHTVEPRRRKPCRGEERITRFRTLAARFHELHRPPFHVFREEFGDFLYHTVHKSILRISEAHFEILNEIEQSAPNVGYLTPRPTSDAWTDLLFVDRDGSMERALGDIELLAESGLFVLDNVHGRFDEQAIRAFSRQAPRGMMLLVHTGCNLACTYCYELQTHLTGRRMTTAEARSAVDAFVKRARRRNPLRITFFGGEPTLAFETIKYVVEYCEDLSRKGVKRFEYSITTNGTLLTEEMMDFFVKHKFTGMASLDGPPELNDVHRLDHSGQGQGETSARNFQTMVRKQKAAGIRPWKVRATMTKQNHDKIRLWEYFRSIGFDRISIGGSVGNAGERMPWDLSEGDWVDLAEAEREIEKRFLDALKNGRRIPPIARELMLAVKGLHESLNSQETPGLMCGAGRNMLADAPDGKTYPCHRFVGMERFVLGEQHEVDPVRVEKFYRDVFDAHTGHCGKCWARTLCSGRCAHYLSNADGSISHPDRQFCDNARQGLERSVARYAYVKEAFPAVFAQCITSEDESLGGFKELPVIR